MASARSLGISTPSALQYLVSEGILPLDPAPEDYTWHTDQAAIDNATADELLYTKECVVWSRHGVIQRVLNFEVENESVTNALFVTFPEDASSQIQETVKAQGSRPRSLLSGDIDQPLKIQKRARSEGKGKSHNNPLKAPYAALKSSALEFKQKGETKRRAIVVTLKTQAHIFFISGTSHVINLPFEPASAFATPHGLIIQRNMASRGDLPSFQKLPKTPANSYSISLLDSFKSTSNLQSSGAAQDEPPLLTSMFRSLLASSQQSTGNKLPHHVYLRDPLTEMGVVGEVEENDASSSRLGNTYSDCRQLPGVERLIYVSPSSEFDAKAGDPSLLLALTWSTSLGLFTLWRVVETPTGLLNKNRRRAKLNSGASTARRRSSHGAGTGANTPALRGSVNPRESFGPLKEPQNDQLPRNDTELASQLDPAFENPADPAKSSRRISSLLARSDLTVSQDISNLTDPLLGHGVGVGQRRGPSFGHGTLRASFGLSNRQHGMTKATHQHQKNNALDDDSSDDSDDTEMIGSMEERRGTGSKRAIQSLQHDIAFVRIHSFSPSQLEPQAKAPPSIDLDLVSAFTVESASQDPQKLRELVLCIFNSGTRRLFVVSLTIQLSSTHRPKSHSLFSAVQIRAKDIQGAKGVISVCRIKDGRRSRIIMLTESEDGYGTLILQSPGNIPIPVALPSQLLIRNPFECAQKFPQAKKRDGGLKRVLSSGLDRMCRLRSSPIFNQFDIQDAKGVWHRLEIDTIPESDFVLRALGVCQFVLPPSPAEREPMMRAWYEAKIWLQNRDENLASLEWTAFVVTLFSMFIPFIRDRNRQSAIRGKKKAGLLRSSSGANLDTESFDAMILREDKLGTNTPPWLKSSSWQWAIESIPTHTATESGKMAYSPFLKRISFLPDCLNLARDFVSSESGKSAVGENGYLMSVRGKESNESHSSLPVLLAALHLLREESKLNILDSELVHSLTPVLAQMGGWLGCEEWNWRDPSFYSLESMDLERWVFDDLTMQPLLPGRPQSPPPSILQHVESTLSGASNASYPSLLDVTRSSDPSSVQCLKELTPRTVMLAQLLELLRTSSSDSVDQLLNSGWRLSLLETFPEGIAAPVRSAIAACQSEPSTKLSPVALALIDRRDIAMLEQREQIQRPPNRPAELPFHDAARDYHSICASALDMDQIGSYDGSAELDRQAVTRLVFKDDQRFSEAAKLVHPMRPAVARCLPEPDWSDTDLLEAQQEMAKVIAIRTLSVSAGRAMIFYSARFPLLTEKFPIHGFTLSCIMKPANTTVTADKNSYSEEKVSWAFFHAGVEAGLSISKGAKGVDTSWILFNKPRELGDRHAGFLFALGLNGHLKSIAKWVAFKYLTPKHTMTSIGLLLGLSASYLGTMDTLITRLLSVHVTRMLPPRAAQLNLSPLTQTTGIMALGLLYCSTQHRRMTEVMISEMENVDQDDSINPLESLRGEGYRLATGFALGYINLGQGKRLKGLRDMRIVERLLALAVATKKVDLVHILDKATAAATIAIALIFLKSEDTALAKKIDIPDTIHQFEYVRPDHFLLRTVARHLIMWKDITPTIAWMQQQLPIPLRRRVKLNHIQALHSDDLPLYNIIAGLCVSIGLRFAGSARRDVRDVLGLYLDQFIRISRLPALHYDGRLTRITTRNCQDAIALAAASVMAGTGDVYLMRRFRLLHGRSDLDTPYGSHLAAHQALGILFLAGGTHTFNTSDLAVASLLCAFYPLFPTNVQDCRSHLQAFRHFWVFAAEPRCIIIRSAETHRPLSIPIVIVLRSGEEFESIAPCLLPELDSIARVCSNDPQFWRVTLDFAGNPGHLAAFKRHQSMFVRRRGPYDASSSVFAATMQALNDQQMKNQISRQAFEWVFDLPSFATFDRAEKALVLPNETSAMLHLAGRTTVMDDRLALEQECIKSGQAERLWNLRVLFAWADRTRKEGKEVAWLGKEVVEALRAKVALMWRDES
ncbi:Anaphase-promoting complex subunit 1 [Thelotrema lepadinum]|nr:Anaphase-promoting complex subunit 1 [Thelotrema lepadinum]